MADQSQAPQQHSTGDSRWQQTVLEKLATDALKEQRTTRRWGTFFKILTFAYLFVLLFYAMGLLGESKALSKSHTAMIDIAGVIQAGGDVDADAVLSSLQTAFDDEGTKGVILRINSPGGSPVQAGIINDEIHRQRKLHPEIPLYAVVEDICASGGYYIAVAADKIYVDKGSIVGSIGVLMDGYGFTEVMGKVGVERRLLTAGENKAMLDPFSPVNPKHVAFAKTLLSEIHEQFKTVVREGRGERLHETPELFSGLFWNGTQSIKLGLADAEGSAGYVAREVIKEENIVDFTYQEDFPSRLAKRFGAYLGKSISANALQELVSGQNLRLR